MAEFMTILREEIEKAVDRNKIITFKTDFIYTITCELKGTRFASYVLFVNEDRHIIKIEMIDADINTTSYATIKPLTNHEDAFDPQTIMDNITSSSYQLKQ